jgi:membrane-bound lytic murein transglycosylase D
MFSLFLAAMTVSQPLLAAQTTPSSAASATATVPVLSLKEKLQSLTRKTNQRNVDGNELIFDLPVTYNKKVSNWVHFYQTRGQRWFREWLGRSSKYLPFIQAELRRANMPTDLAFMVMIESGFSAQAVSSAEAVGPWQFIAPTGSRYGLQKNWWLDERRDLKKSTLAAIRYLKDLREEFGSWYLVAASYNMGENGLRRQIKKYKTKDYWTLVQLGALPVETQEYVPKILAAMLIAKAPNLYGFRDLTRMDPLDYEVVSVAGGTELDAIADHLGVTRKSLKDLNAELVLGYIPRQVSHHYIRVPKGAAGMVADYKSSLQ